MVNRMMIHVPTEALGNNYNAKRSKDKVLFKQSVKPRWKIKQALLSSLKSTLSSVRVCVCV